MRFGTTQSSRRSGIRKISSSGTKGDITTSNCRYRCVWCERCPTLGPNRPLALIEPALASSIERVPSGERWVHEIKFDGYRVQLHIANESIRVFTRRGNDWTNRFRKIANEAFLISANSAIIDGAVVVPAAHQLQMKEAAN